MSVPETEKDIIAEFQHRRREFKPRWTRNVGLVFFPGFVIFVIGGALPGMRRGANAEDACAVSCVRWMWEPTLDRREGFDLNDDDVKKAQILLEPGVHGLLGSRRALPGIGGDVFMAGRSPVGVDFG